MPKVSLLPKPDTTLPGLPENTGGTSEPYTSPGLSYECVDVDAVSVDWREAYGEDCEGWRSYEAFEGESGFVRVLGCDDSSTDQDIDDEELAEQFDEVFPETDPDSVVDENADGEGGTLTALGYWEGQVSSDSEESAEGPAMSFYWPLGDVEPKDAAREIRRLPLCIVEFGDERRDKGAPEYALALVGGGTDLSWEIAEAYVRLGFFPPAALTLPRMSGRADGSAYGNMERDKRIIEACRESAEAIKGRMTRKLETLADLEVECVSGTSC